MHHPAESSTPPKPALRLACLLCLLLLRAPGPELSLPLTYLTLWV